MSTNTNQQDWWDIFTHMSVEKLKQRHRSEIEMYPSSFSNQFYIQVKGTKFVQLEFEHGIGNELVKQVVQWSRDREKVESRQIISSSDSDVLQLKHLLLGRAKQFIDFCVSDKSIEPESTIAQLGISDVVLDRWPKKSFAAPVYYHIWGWLQLELGKKGEQQMPITLKRERQLSEYCRINNLFIKKKEYDSQLNVRYLVKEKNHEG